jgi:hypothetical protein
MRSFEEADCGAAVKARAAYLGGVCWGSVSVVRGRRMRRGSIGWTVGAGRVTCGWTIVGRMIDTPGRVGRVAPGIGCCAGGTVALGRVGKFGLTGGWRGGT